MPGRTLDDALRGAQAYPEQNERDYPAAYAPAAAPEWEQRAEALWIDQYELPAREAARPRAQGIRIDRSDRVAVSRDSFSEWTMRAAIAAAVACVIVGGFFWIGGSQWVSVSKPTPAPAASASAPAAGQSNNVITSKIAPAPAAPAAAMPATAQTQTIATDGKEDRAPAGIADLIARENAEPLRKVPEPTRTAAPAPKKETATPRQIAQRTEAEPAARRLLAPVPETRPNTIPGWSVREAGGDSAVLDGPQGTRRVAPGESVPGLGRVETIVRWGNRWIVTTERGLISTN